MSHTKGPWIVKKYSNIECSPDLVFIGQSTSSNNLDLAQEQLEANAKLMAAAPEMLVALKKIKMQIEDQGLQDRFALALSHIYSALKRAGGV